ncbi:MAG: PQQ-binding-like beta-propeller repeat protein [Planctomycetes bacterium]|nr:PQQ-binding-like beta-propeller repeat protein [Planctomycetota bacterium]
MFDSPNRCALKLLSVFIVMLVVSPLSAEDWPQFRGPNCSGISTSTKSLPVKFSETENVLWSSRLGDGIGSPVVAAGRVFTSAMVDDKTIGLYAFDAATGRKLWGRSWPVGDAYEIHGTNSHASTTPAADAKRVYFYYSSIGMVALDAQSGADVWQQKLPVPFFVFKWGAGMSPTLYKDKVLFVQDDDLYPAFYAFDKKTGKILWKDERHDMAVNYSHPVICRTKTGDEIVVAGTGMLVGYDPNTGKRLWKARTLLRNIKTTPVSFNGIVYVALQSSGIANQWLVSVDQAETGNSDGKLTREEVQAFVGKDIVPEAFFEKTFGRGDLNKDGYLEGKELDVAFLHPDNMAGASFGTKNPGQQFIMAVRGGGRGDVTKSHLLWKHETEHTDHIVSPLVVNNRMWLIKGGGIATCFDMKAGQSLWGPKRLQNTCDYFASPVYGDGKIYISGENGVVVVLDNGPEMKLLAKNQFESGILGTPAIADGRLFIRTRNKLICVGNE